jgi:hypothetical protein
MPTGADAGDRMRSPVARFRAVVAAALVAASAGCLGGESLGGAGTPGAGGTSGSTGATGGGGAGGDGPLPIGTGSAGSFCSVQTVPVMPSIPDVLILMDRSSSMNDDGNGMTCAGGCGPSSKWSLLSAAVEDLMAQNPRVNWGLALYGSDNACDTGSGAVVGVGPRNAAAITAALAATTPGGEAPTGDAITNAVADLQVIYDGLAKYILLVADGHSGCGADEATANDAAATGIGIALTQSRIPTLVLGPDLGSDTVANFALDQWAASGGLASPADARSYCTPEDVGAGFAAVLSTGSCVLPLPNPPVAMINLALSLTLNYGSVVAVPQNTMNGWAYTDPTMTAIVLSRTYCADLADGTATSATFSYVCQVTSIDTR